MHPYLEYINPHLGRRLVQVGLDKRFVRGSGCLLYDADGIEYLDCIAAYGALPFGYNPPRIWEALRDVQERMEPSFIQPSLLEAAGALAEVLVKSAPPGMAYVTFVNSGAEAVEAALKLSRAKTGRMGILSTRNSFHGKTLGALSATGNPSYQRAFGAPLPGFAYVRYGDADALREYLEKHGEETAAFIVEPIQGEGGIVEPPPGYLRQVKDICAQYGVVTIFDEIQTGLGRTGSLFACEEEGVTPDVMLIAKALGGGLLPIGAVLCTADVYTEEFGFKHSSTFAGNTLGCRVGLKVMEILTENGGALIRDVRAKGGLLKSMLVEVAERYPSVIRGIRGRGLMLGVDFGSDKDLYPHSLLGVAAEQEFLTPLVASYLLNTERVRVAPTLNGASVIRIEPPLIITEQQIGRIAEAVDRAARMLAQRSTAHLLGHLIGWKPPAAQPASPAGAITNVQPEPVPQQGDGRFAFLVHPVDLSNYSDFDASLAVFSDEQLQDLSSRWNNMVEPFVVGSTRVVSSTGAAAYGDFICVPRTADELLAMPKAQAIEEIKAAVNLAVERGAKLVGLGAYTSVVTMGGRSLLPHVDVALTTGNSYTVFSGVEAVTTAAAQVGMPLERSTAAVVGAGGAIGKALSTLLAEHVHRMILIGNPSNPAKSRYRLQRVVVQILQHLCGSLRQGRAFAPGTIGDYLSQLQGLPEQDAEFSTWLEASERLLEEGLPIVLTTDAFTHLPSADVVVAATSSPEALIQPDMLKWGAVVCDMSRPANVSRDVARQRPDVLVIDGGVVEVPNRPSLGWNFGFAEGQAYACMSETMMLALEQRYENASLGADLNIEFIQYMGRLARIHGFRLAGLRSFDRPLTAEACAQVRNLRQDGNMAQHA
mgnify:CR=1 FL=1